MALLGLSSSHFWNELSTQYDSLLSAIFALSVCNKRLSRAAAMSLAVCSLRISLIPASTFPAICGVTGNG